VAPFVGLLIALSSCHQPPGEEGRAPGAGMAAVSAPTDASSVVAMVNDESIEAWEVESALKEIELMALHPIPAAERGTSREKILERIIGHHLLAQAARSQKLEVSAADVDGDINSLREEYGGADGFNRMLGYLGITPEQLHRQRRLRLEMARFVEGNTGSISVAAAEVDEYYGENRDQFKTPDSITASHILIRSPQLAPAEEKAAARSRAAALLEQLRGGADFAQLAREHSEDQETAASGGALGAIDREQTDPAFAEVVFTLAPGELSPVVETAQGFHVAKVHQRTPATTRPLAEVREEIEALLQARVRDARVSALVQKMRTTARIQHIPLDGTAAR
jgi:parvulin-like peptidyl-prolyl isomerase